MIFKDSSEIKKTVNYELYLFIEKKFSYIIIALSIFTFFELFT